MVEKGGEAPKARGKESGRSAEDFLQADVRDGGMRAGGFGLFPKRKKIPRAMRRGGRTDR